MRYFMIIFAVAALAAMGAGVVQAQIEWGNEPQEQTDKQADEKTTDGNSDQPAEGADQDSEKPEQTEERRKIDQSLGIDWGDDQDKKEKPEDPNARQPSTKVDLTTALEEGQIKRLDRIKKNAEAADNLAELAAETRAGNNKQLPKERCVMQYNQASNLYLKAGKDIENLAKSIKDEDTKLTLLRQYGDEYRKKAINMLCEAGYATLEFQNTLPGIKAAVGFFKRARSIDENDGGWRNGYIAAQNAMVALAEKSKTTTTTTGGSTGEKEESYVESTRDRDELIHPGRRDDPKRTGR